MQKINFKVILFFLLTIAFIACIIATRIAFADNVIDNSESKYVVYNSDREEVLTVTMKEGKITIVAKSHAATTNTRWRTIGLTITKRAVNSTGASVLGYSGPSDLSTVYSYGKGILWFRDAKVTDYPPINGITTRYIEFDATQVEDALGADFEEITVNTPIYMHAIFETYSAATGAINKSNLINWKDIMKAESWGADTLSDFKKYYNMNILFKPAVQPTTLYYISDDGKKFGSKELDSVLPNMSVSWSNEPTTQKDGKYELKEYYVSKKRDKNNTKLVYHSIGDKDGCKLTDIRSNSIQRVRLGGMNVFLVYKIKRKPGITPTPTPKPHISGTPTPTQAPTPSPTPVPIEVPEEKTISAPINFPEALGVIAADNRGGEKFMVSLGIPTTESLFTQVTSDNYLMGYEFKRQVGINTYSVKVTKNYILEWTGKDKKGKKQMTETVPVVQYVSIKRAYAYWEILNFDYYVIDNAVINNYALPNGSTIMKPDFNAGYILPQIAILHSQFMQDHVFAPVEFTNGIELSSETITGGSSKPSVPNEDLSQMANEVLPELLIKNDTLSIDGVAVIDNSLTEKEGPDVNEDYLSMVKASGEDKCNESVLYKPNQIIEATKKNGRYSSSGTISYISTKSVNSIYTSTIQGNIMNISNVTIHTPVLCNPVIVADNDKYVQLLYPTSATQLVLDPDSTLNDFSLQISNTGFHTGIQGYFTRDFSRSLRDPEKVSYLAEDNGVLLNEVKFPFDVFIKKDDGDKFIKKNTWIVMGRSTVKFFLPMWVQEGIYTAACRSIAVNADMTRLDYISEFNLNSQLFNYVATNTFDVEVSGRIYGLSIYDLTDYPMWQEAFRVKNSLQLKINNLSRYSDGTDQLAYNPNFSYYYTVGTNDQYGKDTKRNVKFTFPLVNGNHPYYKNIGVLKTGYVVRFKLNTIGTMYGNGCSVKINPAFYYVDADGKNRQQVDIYYEEEIDHRDRKLVKMGSNLDKLNVKSIETGSPYNGIPKEDMKNTAAIMNVKYSSFISRRDNLFSFTNINIVSSFRTFVNKAFTKKIVNGDQYSSINSCGITINDMMKQMQTWYGCYYLPANMHVVNPVDVPNGWTVYEYAQKKGITYHENWWKKGGYIIVNFDIVTIDSNGTEHLSYINSDNYLAKNNCSMWVMEGAPLSKVDNKGVTFNFKPGDFILYYSNQSINNDYSSDGIY